MKLELKHLVGYLPYELKFYWEQLDGTPNKPWTLTIKGIEFALKNQNKPILRPLSDLFNGKYEDILDEFSEQSLEAFKIAFLSELRPLDAFDKINYTIATKLFKNHFDLFRLIEDGLAVDINTL